MPEIMVRYDELRQYCEKRHCGSVPLEYIKQIPTIEAEPVRHGRWIVHTTWHGMFGLIHSECSECKFDRNGDLSSWKFCPNCGSMNSEV